MVFEMRGATLDAFAQLLHPGGHPVVNRTGLTGTFDFHLEWEDDAADSPDGGVGSDPSPHAYQNEAVRKQLGLRLDPGKITRELLVIDHVEKPSAN
jgi:uncharacterized protein (TIGR03435 family)